MIIIYINKETEEEEPNFIYEDEDIYLTNNN